MINRASRSTDHINDWSWPGSSRPPRSRMARPCPVKRGRRDTPGDDGVQCVNAGKTYSYVGEQFVRKNSMSLSGQVWWIVGFPVAPRLPPEVFKNRYIRRSSL